MKRGWIVVVGAMVFFMAVQLVLNRSLKRSASLEKTISPIRIRFDAAEPPKLNEPVPVSIIIERDPRRPPIALEGTDRLNLLLRLPVGIKLAAEGWRSVPIPKKEKNDPSGPWTLFERDEPVLTGENSPCSAPIPIRLTVVEEGTNWVITARAKLIQKKNVWQTFGVLFATLRKGTAAFHTVPRAPSADHA